MITVNRTNLSSWEILLPFFPIFYQIENGISIIRIVGIHTFLGRISYYEHKLFYKGVVRLMYSTISKLLLLQWKVSKFTTFLKRKLKTKTFFYPHPLKIFHKINFSDLCEGLFLLSNARKGLTLIERWTQLSSIFEKSEWKTYSPVSSLFTWLFWQNEPTIKILLWNISLNFHRFRKGFKRFQCAISVKFPWFFADRVCSTPFVPLTNSM